MIVDAKATDGRQFMCFNSVVITPTRDDQKRVRWSAKVEFFDNGFAQPTTPEGNVTVSGCLQSYYSSLDDGVTGRCGAIIIVEDLLRDLKTLNIIRQDEYYGTMPFAVFVDGSYEDITENEYLPVKEWAEAQGFHFGYDSGQ